MTPATLLTVSACCLSIQNIQTIFPVLPTNGYTWCIFINIVFLLWTQGNVERPSNSRHFEVIMELFTGWFTANLYFKTCCHIPIYCTSSTEFFMCHLFSQRKVCIVCADRNFSYGKIRPDFVVVSSKLPTGESDTWESANRQFYGAYSKWLP